MKRKKKSSVQILKDKAEDLWKEYCLLRDGRECQVKKYFPEIQIIHTDVYQVDHCFTRANKHLLYRTSNGTVVCNSCNRTKNFKNKSVARAIDEIVKKREGEIYDQMLKIDQSLSANPNFSRVWWLEEVIIGLEAQIMEIKNEAIDPKLVKDTYWG